MSILLFYAWLVSLNVLHVCLYCCRISFFNMVEQNFIAFICHIFFIHLSLNEHWGWFHILAILSPQNTDFLSFANVSRSGSAGSHGHPILNFCRKLPIFSIMVILMLVFTSIDKRHYNMYEMIPHGSFNHKHFTFTSSSSVRLLSLVFYRDVTLIQTACLCKIKLYRAFLLNCQPDITGI